MTVRIDEGNEPGRAGWPVAFGRYVVQRRLGAGGFAAVLLATDPVLGRDVAVKVPHGEGWSSGELIEEARALARLRHGSIVQVLDAGFEAGRAYFVMELVEGRSLEELVAMQRRNWSPQEAIALLGGPAAAVDHAHSQGILHRDIKPENLLVPAGRTRAGGGDAPAVKVADFGLWALAHRGRAGGAAPPAAGDPRYAAPESWEGRPTEASDVYSLAAVFFRLLTGRHPLPGTTPQELVSAVADRERRALAPLRSDLPQALDAALARALAVRPSARPHSGAELLTSLESALDRARERKREVADARERIAARSGPGRTSCSACRWPVHPRESVCPRCGEPVGA